MRNFKHKWKIAFASVVLTGTFLFFTNTHPTTQAAAPPAARAVAASEAVFQMRPIIAVDAMGGSELTASNKTDW